MIEIQGKRKKIVLPSAWEDLSTKQFILTIVKLLELLGRQIKINEFRLALLLLYTGYKPGSDARIQRWQVLKFRLKLCCVSVKYFLLFLFGRFRFRAMLTLLGEWRRIHFPDLSAIAERREIINSNLVILSEQIKFPLREGRDGWEVNNSFNRNPIPWIRPRLRRYAGKQFDVGIIIRTNITAREFSDAFDIVKAFAESHSEECLNALCAILYPRYSLHSRNISSRHYKHFERVSYPVRYAVMIWFTGIVRYFTEHAIYRVLFSGTGEQNEKINLGMTETIMSLSLVGFGTTAEMERVSVVDYFDMQVKALKKMISDARGGGATLDDIAKATKLSYAVIEQLS